MLLLRLRLAARGLGRGLSGRVCCSGAGLAGEVARLVLSGVAVHLKLRVWLLLLLLLLFLQCVALHLQSVFGAQRPVEEQAGHAHLPSRLSGAVRPHGRG